MFAQLRQKEDCDHSKWVLDTGATNHMTGSAVKIEGRDVVLFGCKNDEHRALTRVYFIP